MILQFADGTQLEAIRVMGGVEHHHGAARDTLTIDLQPTYTFDELASIFTNSNKTEKIISIATDDETDEETTAQENLIGEDYTIFCSISYEARDVRTQPGIVTPPQQEEVWQVKIAQVLYLEKMLQAAGLEGHMQPMIALTQLNKTVPGAGGSEA